MKRLIPFLLMAIAFAACNVDDSQLLTYKINEPIFVDKAEFRSAVQVTSQKKDLTTIGKMCYYEGYLFISDPGAGIHILDNTSPANPKLIAYIEVPGNYDITVCNQILYADAMMDLLWFDISNPSSPEFKGRIEDAFQCFAYPETGNDYYCDWEAVSEGQQNGKLVLGWTVGERTEKIQHGDWDDLYTDSGPNSVGSKGTTGSMSRFTLYDNYLYVVMNYRMTIFDLSAETPVKREETTYLEWDVETIFSYKDNLFMGTPTGLLIYSVTDPLSPQYCSSIQHVYGCDPVVVENDIAYVTIHSGNSCGQDNNQLIIIDVSNVLAPKEIVSYAMTHPKGLGIDQGILFLCDDGLKVFKAEDPQTIMANRLAHYKGMDGYDVIPFNNILMMISDKGLYQYDYSNLNDIKFLSRIPIK
ncbi:hypothetical protein LJB91_00260 [Bacteroidales bacterium OttesenSCG-928-L03]|nr:hypothetical protein [Bacteroidales bacterium OttesenSCG-928-L03]